MPWGSLQVRTPVLSDHFMQGQIKGQKGAIRKKFKLKAKPVRQNEVWEPKILDLGNPHPSLGAVQTKEANGDPRVVPAKAGDFNYCLSSRLEMEKGRSSDLDEQVLCT